MVHNVIRFFYPDLQTDEIRRFSLLAGIFSLIIGTYWLLRLLKNTIFLKVAFPEELGWAHGQGLLSQPTAKFWSPFVVLIMVLVYSKLVDLVKKHQLFYVICSFYTLLFVACAAMLFVKDFYGAQYLGKFALSSIGWVSYFAIESFGSLVVALFWSFTNSITDSASAKRGFPFVVAMAQISAILGSGLLFFSSSIGALWPILLLAGILVAAIIPLVSYFVATTPADQMVGNVMAAVEEKTHKDGFFEGFFSGLILLFTRPYLLGVLLVSTLYETISQIVEYQMSNLAYHHPVYGSGEIALAQFQSMYGVGINAVSFIIALLGTSYLIKHFGLRISLLISPLVFACSLASLYAFFWAGQSAIALLWATFAVMLTMRGIGYAVNNPIKEMMYIPTSKDAKFKSKGWIDTFGSRFAKAGGAQVNNAFKHSMSELMIFGTMFSFGLVGVWIAAAIFVGYKNKQLVDQGHIIE